MKFKVRHTWGKKGKEESYCTVLENAQFLVLYSSIFREFAAMATPGDFLEIRLGNLHYTVNVEGD